MATIVEQAKAQMAKSVESTKENFSGIRTGRANPALLNGITVDYYGAPTPLKAVATIGVPEPRTLSAVSYTHLDVYKRQAHRCRTNVLQHGVRTNGNSLEMRIF